MIRLTHFACFLTFGFTLLTAGLTQATDWPQWRGPQRDGVWRESGVIDEIPESGLPVKWRVEVGLGYSGPAVADGKVFVADYQKQSGELRNSAGGVTELTGQERLLCLDEKTGEEIWKAAYEQPYRVSYAGGPRCTPTVDGDRVYFLGAEGRLGCYNTANGDEVWSKDLNKEYKTKTPHWGFAAHPLVVGDLLYCVVGGKGSVAVAFNKMTGKEVWRALDADPPGYCAPTMIEAGGVRQLLIWTPLALNSLNLKTGEVYWSLPLQPQYNMSITVPVKHGNQLYVSGVGSVGGLIQLDEDKPGAEFVWKGNSKSAIYSCNAPPLIEDETIYGCDIETSALVAARLSDGERLWVTTEPTVGDAARTRYGTAFLVKHDDHFFLFSEKGDLILADLSPEGYKELGRFHVLEPTNHTRVRAVVWSHPAFANKCLFARNDKEVVCVDLEK
jgi:outer membrane protein assembly factor BamB